MLQAGGGGGEVLTGRKRPPKEGREVGKGGRKGGSKTEGVRTFGEFPQPGSSS